LAIPLREAKAKLKGLWSQRRRRMFIYCCQPH
jgi:hypothetical protein